MANRTIKTLRVSGTVSRIKIRAAVKAVRAHTKLGKIVVSKARPIKSKQTASGKRLISFKVAKVG